MGIKSIIIISIFLILLVSISFVSAITGSIGNARMILRAETGDTIERSILVKNVNDVALDIDVFATGDLVDDITIKDSKFRLEAGEEKDAFFTIKVRKEGTSESRINVMFKPEEGNGVGLSSTVIVIAEKGPGIFDFGDGNKDDVPKTKKLDFKILMGILLTITTFILLVLVIILSQYANNNQAKKRYKLNQTIKPKKSVRTR